MINLMQGDCLELIKDIQSDNSIIVTDPPFNIGYHYRSYRDRMKKEEYYSWLAKIFECFPCAVVHYPESLHKLSVAMGRTPCRIVSWVYNSNTARQHRDIAFYDVKPNFNQVKQPYKNPTDKRIQERMASGKTGCKLYDWWNVNQVKNVSKDKTAHPCQMPQEVMNNIIGILPQNATIIDPFMGSGTTGVACVNMGRDFVGMELDPQYFEIAKKRIEEAQAQLKITV